ncbi:MAG: CoA ester lyase [Desulfarculaceae bacterium]|nr:CoA ester lyase [Desulfarculaceae bacterium]MCF8071578.1 CoA ester lyase [Desulfarculaceae bacterium]MCF8102393.1 CoA ester lyase [Desulfarculaceae bacterium]MCF8114857.1 CoA ester lyase [Desulfarculaceae bacterium]
MPGLGLMRSLLFVPGARLDRLDKALATGADMVIVDLEDAVAPGQKEAARDAVAGRLAASPGAPVMVRVNGLDSPWVEKDLATVVPQGSAGLVLPKIAGPGDLARYDQLIAAQEAEPGALPMLGLVETVPGVQNLPALAAQAPDRLHTLVFGAVDYTLELGGLITPEGYELIYPRSRMAVACKAGGLEPPLDTPYMLDLKDQVGLEADARRARSLGFGGKLCVHPAQVEVVNRVFSPSSEELDFAREVLDAFAQAEARGEGVIQVRGKLVDLPVVVQARRTLRLHQEIQRRAADPS